MRSLWYLASYEHPMAASGQDEEHSSLLVNSVNVNDPATGSFGLSIPIDSVDILKVMQSPYLAQSEWSIDKKPPVLPRRL